MIFIFHGYSPTTFDVDTTQLNEKYKELQWKLHPDKFSDVSEVWCADDILNMMAHYEAEEAKNQTDLIVATDVPYQVYKGKF